MHNINLAFLHKTKGQDSHDKNVSDHTIRTDFGVSESNNCNNANVKYSLFDYIHAISFLLPILNHDTRAF